MINYSQNIQKRNKVNRGVYISNIQGMKEPNKLLNHITSAINHSKDGDQIFLKYPNRVGRDQYQNLITSSQNYSLEQQIKANNNKHGHQNVCAQIQNSKQENIDEMGEVIGQKQKQFQKQQEIHQIENDEKSHQLQANQDKIADELIEINEHSGHKFIQQRNKIRLNKKSLSNMNLDWNIDSCKNSHS